MSSREVIKLIEQDGWYLVAVAGSHHQFKHPHKPGKVTIPHPSRTLARRRSSQYSGRQGCSRQTDLIEEAWTHGQIHLSGDLRSQ